MNKLLLSNLHCATLFFSKILNMAGQVPISYTEQVLTATGLWCRIPELGIMHVDKGLSYLNAPGRAPGMYCSCSVIVREDHQAEWHVTFKTQMTYLHILMTYLQILTTSVTSLH